jgi:diadenosine tetraphosphate (Ap4A) HIT family hydrolase
MAGSAAGWRRFVAFAAVFVAGVMVGGWGVRDVQPRSFLGVDHGRNPVSLAELAGLVGSAVVQHAPNLLPVVMTTARSVVVRYPFAHQRVHDVVIPRRDIYDPGTLAQGDEAYLVDAFATMAELARREHLTRYKIIANGPGEQSVRYLHFHLVSIEGKGPIGTDRDTLRYDVP